MRRARPWSLGDLRQLGMIRMMTDSPSACRAQEASFCAAAWSVWLHGLPEPGSAMA